MVMKAVEEQGRIGDFLNKCIQDSVANGGTIEKLSITLLLTAVELHCQVHAIQSQSIGGGGGGGGAVASGGDVGQVQQSSFFNVNLQGEGNIGRGAVRGLISQINDEIEDGAVLRGITVSG